MNDLSLAISVPELHSEAIFWLSTLAVRDGQAVEADQFLARLEGKGFSHDLRSPRAGYVEGLHVVPGQIIRPGQILCYLVEQPSIAAPHTGRSALQGSAPFDPTAILVFGGGGHGKTVIDLLRALGVYRIIGVIDDGLPLGSDVLGVPVVGGAQTLEEWSSRGVRLAVNAVGGIGNVNVRLKIFDLLQQAGFTCPPIVHPSAVVERSALLEAGTQVLAQSYVSSAARIGFGSVLNAGVIVSHDCTLGRVVNLSPGATLAGNVYVEDYVQIGMRATVNLGLRIGERAMLGNGCTVKSNVPPAMRVRAGTIWPPLPTAKIEAPDRGA